MADQPEVPADVTPEQFFAQLLPMGFQAQRDAGAQTPQDFVIGYTLEGDGGGEWLVEIAAGEMSTRPGTGSSNLRFTLTVSDWRDAILGQNGASIAVLLPQSRPGRPDSSGRAKMIKGTMALELARDGMDPYRATMTFNETATPKVVMKMKLADFVAMNEGRLNGQEAFMTGKMRVEGDMALLMQIATLNA